MTSLDELLDSLFHGCAFKAFVEVATETERAPCPELTRMRAYRYYEESLAEKNGPVGPPPVHRPAKQKQLQDTEEA